MTTGFHIVRHIAGRLEQSGHFGLTPWWAEKLERFYSHPTARVFVGQIPFGYNQVWLGVVKTGGFLWNVGPSASRHASQHK